MSLRLRPAESLEVIHISTEFNGNMPIYLQIIRHFEVSVARGELKPGSKLPSVRDTALRMQVNPNTVQRAYQEMERTGLVISKRGQGSFVTEDAQLLIELRNQLAQESMQRFVSEMLALGYKINELNHLLAHLVETDQVGTANKEDSDV